LKENIIMGRLIPAGTGLAAYKRWKIVVDETGAEAPSLLPGMARTADGLPAQT
jgi:DNA-directed RNA polymerase subunit beta'